MFMSNHTNWFGGEDLRPKDFLVDVSTDYVTFFPADLGISIGFLLRPAGYAGQVLPHDFSSDRIYDCRDWQAEVMHWSNWLPPPDDVTLARILTRASQLYVQALRSRDFRRAIRDRLPSPLSKAHFRAARAEVRCANDQRLRIHRTGRRTRSDDRPAGRVHLS
jgi:hypothetical protein